MNGFFARTSWTSVNLGTSFPYHDWKTHHAQRENDWHLGTKVSLEDLWEHLKNENLKNLAQLIKLGAPKCMVFANSLLGMKIGLKGRRDKQVCSWELLFLIQNTWFFACAAKNFGFLGMKTSLEILTDYLRNANFQKSGQIIRLSAHKWWFLACSYLLFSRRLV